jgi:hypothetical protein
MERWRNEHRECRPEAASGVGMSTGTPELSQRIVKVYHCEVETTVKNKLGATARTYVCLGE